MNVSYCLPNFYDKLPCNYVLYIFAWLIFLFSLSFSPKYSPYLVNSTDADNAIMITKITNYYTSTANDKSHIFVQSWMHSLSVKRLFLNHINIYAIYSYLIQYNVCICCCDYTCFLFHWTSCIIFTQVQIYRHIKFIPKHVRFNHV